jgi:hypothetical protein
LRFGIGKCLNDRGELLRGVDDHSREGIELIIFFRLLAGN